MSDMQGKAVYTMALRRRRERLLGAIAGITLTACWYFAAALDRQAMPPQHSARTSAFDAAFVAANQPAPLTWAPAAETRLASTQPVETAF